MTSRPRRGRVMATLSRRGSATKPMLRVSLDLAPGCAARRQSSCRARLGEGRGGRCSPHGGEHHHVCLLPLEAVHRGNPDLVRHGAAQRLEQRLEQPGLLAAGHKAEGTSTSSLATAAWYGTPSPRRPAAPLTWPLYGVRMATEPTSSLWRRTRLATATARRASCALLKDRPPPLCPKLSLDSRPLTAIMPTAGAPQVNDNGIASGGNAGGRVWG